MKIAYFLLALLKDGKFHSGTALAQQLRVSRSSIWKGADFLKKLSLSIQSVKGKGYRWHEPLELLDKNLITDYLDEDTKGFLSEIEILPLVPSTNDYFLQKSPDKLVQGAVCAAEGQSSGKGRQGRKWHSPFARNLYFSLYWNLNVPLQTYSAVSLVIGLAVINALAELSALPDELGIKWPNDLYFQQAKLGGILIERHRSQGLVIGVGLNVNMPFKELDGRKVTDLASFLGTADSLSRNRLLAVCLRSMIKKLRQFEQLGLSSFFVLWSQYDILRNKVIKINYAGAKVEGLAQGINERGELLVQFGETLKAIRSGDVHFQ